MKSVLTLRSQLHIILLFLVQFGLYGQNPVSDTTCISPNFLKVYGDSLNNVVAKIEQLDDALYVLGYRTTTDPEVSATFMKLSLDGSIIWQVQLPNSYRLHDFIQSGNGFILVGGTQPFGNTSNSLICRIDENGILNWSKIYSFSSRERLTRIVRAPPVSNMAASYYVLGIQRLNGADDQILLEIDGSGNELFYKTLHYYDDQLQSDFLRLNNGDYIMMGSIGNSAQIGRINSDATAAFYATEGNQGHHLYDGVEANGKVYLSGRTNDSAYLLVLNQTGTHKIARYILPNLSAAYRIQADNRGNLYLSGTSNNPNTVNLPLIYKLTESFPTGTTTGLSVEWAKGIYNFESDFIFSNITITNNGDLIYADSRQDPTNGFGGQDVLIGVFDSNMGGMCVIDTFSHVIVGPTVITEGITNNFTINEMDFPPTATFDINTNFTYESAPIECEPTFCNCNEAPIFINCPEVLFLEDCPAIIDFDLTLAIDFCDSSFVNVVCTRSDGLDISAPIIPGSHVFVTCTAYSSDNLESTCEFIAIATDDTPPTCINNNTSIFLDENGIGQLTPNNLIDLAIDNCDPVLSFSAFPDTFSCQDIGVNDITVIVTDDLLNSTTCSLEVTILPSPLNLEINSSSTGCREFQFNLSGGTFNNYSWSSGAGQNSSLHNPVFTYPFNEQFEVCVEAENSNGCVYSACIFHSVDVNCDTCMVAYSYTQDCYDLLFTPTVSGYSNTPSFQWILNDNLVSVDSNFLFNGGPGTYEVCLVASNTICQDTFCETIMVDPIFTTITNCPLGPITINVQNNCQVIDYTPPLEFVNDCLINSTSSYSIEYVREDGLDILDAFQLGFTSIQAIFEGDYGEISTCNFPLQVVDNNDPICTVNDTIFQATQLGGAIVDFGFTPIDDCLNPEISYSPPSGIFYECGVHNITATVVDESGNTSSCDFALEVIGCDGCSTSFEFTQDCYELSFTPVIEGFVDSNVFFRWFINDIDIIEAPSISYNEGPGRVQICLNAFNSICGDGYCEIIEIDSIFTTITNCPTEPIVLNAQNNCQVLDYIPPLGFENDCLIDPIGSYSLQYIRSDGLDILDAFPLGTTSIQAKFVGDFGEVSTCDFSIEVVDNISPECNLDTLNLNLDVNGTAFLDREFIMPFVTDNCDDSVIVEIGQELFTCANLGENTVEVTLQDEAGNLNICQVIVIVQDIIEPECNVLDIVISTEGEAGVVVNFPFQAVDNCGNASITYSSPSGIFYECGEFSITAQVQDLAGNQTECDFLLQVIECDECCQSESNFINITNEEFTLSSSFLQDNCKFILETPDLSPCQYITGLDWGDGTYSELMLSSDALIEHIYTEIGVYELCVTYEERNTTDSCFVNTTCDTITINDNCTFSRSPEIFAKNKLLVYPNPSVHSVQIKFEGDERTKIKNVQIYNCTAELIYEKNNVGRSNFLIEDSILELGIYFLQVELTNGVFLHDKILKR